MPDGIEVNPGGEMLNRRWQLSAVLGVLALLVASSGLLLANPEFCQYSSDGEWEYSPPGSTSVFTFHQPDGAVSYWVTDTGGWWWDGYYNQYGDLESHTYGDDEGGWHYETGTSDWDTDWGTSNVEIAYGCCEEPTPR